MARLDAFARAIEQHRRPEADIAAAVARERAMSAALGGRTVFDDHDSARASRHGQLHLFRD
jgi:hypothetical protein